MQIDLHKTLFNPVVTALDVCDSTGKFITRIIGVIREEGAAEGPLLTIQFSLLKFPLSLQSYPRRFEGEFKVSESIIHTEDFHIIHPVFSPAKMIFPELAGPEVEPGDIWKNFVQELAEEMGVEGGISLHPTSEEDLGVNWSFSSPATRNRQIKPRIEHDDHREFAVRHHRLNSSSNGNPDLEKALAHLRRLGMITDTEGVQPRGGISTAMHTMKVKKTKVVDLVENASLYQALPDEVTIMVLGYAFCAPEDNFCRAVGSNLAITRCKQLMADISDEDWDHLTKWGSRQDDRCQVVEFFTSELDGVPIGSVLVMHYEVAVEGTNPYLLEILRDPVELQMINQVLQLTVEMSKMEAGISPREALSSLVYVAIRDQSFLDKSKMERYLKRTLQTLGLTENSNEGAKALTELARGLAGKKITEGAILDTLVQSGVVTVETAEAAKATTTPTPAEA